MVIVYPEGSFYSRVKAEDVPEIVEEHLLKGRIVSRLLYEETVEDDEILSLNETDFYKKQHRVVLENCGSSDRTAIRDALREIQDFHAISGTVSFNENGDGGQDCLLFRITDGTTGETEILAQ